MRECTLHMRCGRLGEVGMETNFRVLRGSVQKVVLVG